MTQSNPFSEDHRFYPVIITFNVITTTFLAVLSAITTIIANSSIEGELALSNTKSIWLTTLYLLGVNIIVPTGTWFANRFGYKRMYTYGVLIFIIGSALVGFSNQFSTLAIGRVIEGIGAGFIFPIGLSLLVEGLPKNKIPLGLNLYIAGAFGGGLGLGIPLAGYFTQYSSWRGVFFLIIPLGLLASLSCWLSRKKDAQLDKSPFDFGGFIFFSTFIASLLIALTLAPIKATAEGWGSPLIIALFVLAAVSLIATIYIEKTHTHPLLPLTLFKDPIFTLGAIALFLLGMSLFASVTVSVEYMINALQYEKFITGKIASIYGIAMATCSIAANQLIKVIPVPIMTIIGLSILTFSYFLNNELDWMTGVNQIFWLLLLRGIGIGLALGPTTILALHGVREDLKNSAATLLTFLRQVGGTYAGTLIAMVSIRRTIFHTARFGEQINAQLPTFKITSRNLYNQIPDQAYNQALIIKNVLTQAYIQGLNDAMIVFGYLTGSVTLILALFIAIRRWKQWRNGRANLNPEKGA